MNMQIGSTGEVTVIVDYYFNSYGTKFPVYVQGPVVKATEKAVCVESNTRNVWFPKSVLEIDQECWHARREEVYHVKAWFRRKGMNIPADAVRG